MMGNYCNRASNLIKRFFKNNHTPIWRIIWNEKPTAQ